MAVSEQVSGSQTATLTTEHILAETGGSNDLPTGGTYVLVVDVANLVATERLDLVAYGKARTGDTARVIYRAVIAGSQDDPLVHMVPIPTAHYTKFTLEQNNGTGRAFPWAVYAI